MHRLVDKRRATGSFVKEKITASRFLLRRNLIEDTALSSEAHKPNYNTLISGNRVSKPSVHAAINLNNL